MRVRRLGVILVATPLTERKNVWLPGKELVLGYPGQYLITTSDGQAVDLTPTLADYEVIEEGILLTIAHQRELERTLGAGAARSSVELLRAVNRLARLEIGGILVDFTPGQWEELRKKAAVQSQPVDEYVSRLVKKFTQDLWEL